MSEGELYKKIRELAGEYKGIYFKKINKEDLEAILDEAKQDFPIRRVAIYELTPELVEDYFYDWFEKWFGEAKASLTEK